jgi:hypothetical protein
LQLLFVFLFFALSFHSQVLLQCFFGLELSCEWKLCLGVEGWML